MQLVWIIKNTYFDPVWYERNESIFFSLGGGINIKIGQKTEFNIVCKLKW